MGNDLTLGSRVIIKYHEYYIKSKQAQDISKMSYDRTPADFMKNIFIAPHNFSDPEHPQHGQYVNLQMKNDLYNDSVYKISSCQFSLMGSAEEELEVAKISKCEGPDPLNGYASMLSNKKSEQNQLICCEDWKIIRKVGPSFASQAVSKYRVKIYQSKQDLFYSQIHPPTAWKLFKYYLFS